MKVLQRRVLAIALAVRREHMTPEEAALAVKALDASPATAASPYHGGAAPTMVRDGAALAQVGSIVRTGVDELPAGVAASMGAAARSAFEEAFRELESDPPRARLLVERVAPGGGDWKAVWDAEDARPPSTRVSPPWSPPQASDPAAPSVHAAVGRRSDPPLPISVRTERLTRVEDAATSRYDLKRELARGGMGRVLIALDRQLGREVAIKEMLIPVTREQHASGSIAGGDLERFLREARVTGQLEHPNIVPVYEIGERADGTVFYSMKLVRGESMADRLREIQRNREWSAGEKLAERLKMLDAFGDACQAVAYAHSRGVVNRDLKPSNIMIGDFGETLVLDWGLARVKGQEDKARKDLIQATAMMTKSPASRPDSTKLTLDGSVVGTPSYMPPEQARGELDEIDERSDVYSLGAVLYELATGKAPFEGPSAELVLRSVLHTDPLPPRQAEPHVPKELEAIILQALAKEKARRISSAKVLAEEVGAFRDGRTISLYQYTLWEQVVRFYRRHRSVSLMVALLVVAMIGGTVTSLTWAKLASAESAAARLAESSARAAEREAKTAQDLAIEAARRAEGQRLAAVSKGAIAEAPSLALLLAIEAGERAPGNAANNALYAALFALSEKRRFMQHELGVGQVAISPDGRRLATGAADFVVRVCDIATGEEVRRWDGLIGGAAWLEWSEDGRRLAAIPRHGTGRVYDVERGIELADLKGHEGDVRGLAARPGGGHFVTWSGDGTARLWAASTGDAIVLKHPGPVGFASFSPDGSLLATCGDDGDLRLWESGSGRERHRLAGHDGPVFTVRFSPDGARLVSAGRDGTARIWDVSSGACLRTITPEAGNASNPAPVYDAAWRADGGALGLAMPHGKGLIYSADGAESTGTLAACPGFRLSQMLPDWSLAYSPAEFTAVLRIPGSGEEIGRLRGHEYGITASSFSRDGTLLATGGSDRWAIVWATRPAAGFERSEFLTAGGWNALSGDLLTAAKVRPGGGIDILETGRRRLLRTFDVPTTDLCACALDASGRRLLVGRTDGSKIEVYDTATGAVLLTLRGDEAPLVAAGFCGAGPVWGSFRDRTLTIFDGSTGERIHKAGLNGGLGREAISPDGRWMAWPTGAGQEIALYDLLKDGLVRMLKGHTGHTLACAWHPDSRHFFTTAADASIRKWSVDEARPVGYFRWPVIQEIRPVVSPDGRFVSASGGGVLRLILSDTMTEFATLEPPGGLRWWMFSTDGRTMALHEAVRGVLLVPLDPLEAARGLAPRALTPAEVNRFEVLPAGERDAYRTRWFEVHRSAYVLTMRGREAARNGDFAAAGAHFEQAAAILPQHWLVPYYRGAATLLQRAARPEGDPARALDEDAALADVGLMIRFGISPDEIRGLEEFRSLRGIPAFEEALRGGN